MSEHLTARVVSRLTFFLPFGGVEETSGERPLLQQIRSPFRLMAGRYVEICQQKTINTRCRAARRQRRDRHGQVSRQPWNEPNLNFSEVFSTVLTHPVAGFHSLYDFAINLTSLAPPTSGANN